MKHLFLLIALLAFSSCGSPEDGATQAMAGDTLKTDSRCVEVSVDVEPPPTTAQEDTDFISEELN